MLNKHLQNTNAEIYTQYVSSKKTSIYNDSLNYVNSTESHLNGLAASYRNCYGKIGIKLSGIDKHILRNS